MLRGNSALLPCGFQAKPDNNLAKQMTRPFPIGYSSYRFSNTYSIQSVSNVMLHAQNTKIHSIYELDYLWAFLDRIPCCHFGDWIPCYSGWKALTEKIWNHHNQAGNWGLKVLKGNSTQLLYLLCSQHSLIESRL